MDVVRVVSREVKVMVMMIIIYSYIALHQIMLLAILYIC